MLVRQYAWNSIQTNPDPYLSDLPDKGPADMEEVIENTVIITSNCNDWSCDNISTLASSSRLVVFTSLNLNCPSYLIKDHNNFLASDWSLGNNPGL